MFKNCYLIYLGGQLDKFDGDLIASLGSLIHNCQGAKHKW